MAVGHQGSRIDFRTRTRFSAEFVEYRRDGPGGRAACDKRRLLRGGQGLAGEAPSSNGGEFGSGQKGDGDDGAIHAECKANMARKALSASQYSTSFPQQ